MKPFRAQEIRLSLRRSKRRTFRVHASGDVAKAFEDLSREVRESVYAVYASSANEVIGIERVSTGTMGTSHASPAEILRTALLVGVKALIIVHNHPSGYPSPSPVDFAVTQQVTRRPDSLRLNSWITSSSADGHSTALWTTVKLALLSGRKSVTTV